MPTKSTDLSLPSKVTITTTGLDIPEGISREQWEEVGATLGRIDKAMPWMVGDWLNAGEREGYIDPDTYDAAEDLFPHLKRGTLHQYAWVARACSTRVEGLSFTHHREVARLDKRGQKKWLNAAKKERWSTEALDRELNQPAKPSPSARWEDVAAAESGDLERARAAIANKSSTDDPGPAVQCPTCGHMVKAESIGVWRDDEAPTPGEPCPTCGWDIPGEGADAAAETARECVARFLAGWDDPRPTSSRDLWDLILEEVPDAELVNSEIPEALGNELDAGASAIEVLLDFTHDGIATGAGPDSAEASEALGVLAPLLPGTPLMDVVEEQIETVISTGVAFQTRLEQVLVKSEHVPAGQVQRGDYIHLEDRWQLVIEVLDEPPAGTDRCDACFTRSDNTWLATPNRTYAILEEEPVQVKARS